MKFLSKILIAGAVLGCLAVGSRGQEEPDQKEAEKKEGFAGQTIVIPVREGTLSDPKNIRVFKELLAKIETDGAAAVIFDIDVVDGNVLEASRWADAVADLKIPTTAFVNRSALAEGAALACASDKILMAKGGRVGLAKPLTEIGEDDSEAVQKSKLERDLSRATSLLESLCERNGHDAEVAVAFADSGKEVKRGDDIISAKGELLTLSASKASKEYDGKPLFASVVEEDEKVIEGEGILVVSLYDFAKGNVAGPIEPETGNEEGAGKSDTTKERRYERAEGEESYEGKIVVIEIDKDDLINTARFEFMKRTLTRASDEGATAVIFDINTPGGLAWDTGQIIIGEMQRMSCPTYAYVNPAAVSAGSLIACSCDKIYMAPGSLIGASAVVKSNYDEMGDVERQKMNSAFSAFARGAAENKGRWRKQVVQCFVVLEDELKIDGVVIDSEDELLTLTANEAIEVYRGEPLLAEGIVKSIEDLIAIEKLEGEVIRAKPTGMEWFAEIVAKYAAFLIMLAVAGAYMEFKTPGFGVAGLVSILAFATFFFGHNIAGSLVGYEEVVVIVLGVILLIVEFFVFPGTMVFGAVGLLLIVGGLVYVMAKLGWGFVGEEGISPGLSDFGFPIFNVSIGLGGAVILMALMMRYLPETSIFRWLILEKSVGGAASLGTVNVQGVEEEVSFVGRTGVVKTDLKPTGKGEFDGEVVEIVSDDGYVNAGERVRVIEQKGTRVVVEKLG